MSRERYILFYESYLQNRKQGVIVNGSFPTWSNILAEVLHGFILDPALSLGVINDIVIDIETNIKLF